MNDPELFESVNILSRRDNTEFIEEHEDGIRKISGRCLDVGSGPGDLMIDILLPKLNPEATVLCSDVSEAMVEFAKNKYEDNPRLSFMKLDIETPDLPNHLQKRFDLVTSFYCFNFCPAIRQVFENIFDLLRPGGTALLVFAAKFPSFNAFKSLSKMPAYKSYMKDADRFIPAFQHSECPRKAMKGLIKDVGFKIRHCSVRNMSYTFEPSVLNKFLVSVSPFVARMPTNLGEAFEKDLMKEVERQNIIINKKNINENEHSILVMYHSFVLCLKKPLSK